MWAFIKSAICITASLALVACSTSPQTFYADSSRVSDTSLCRTYSETEDPNFKADTRTELDQRGISDRECDQLIVAQNIAIGVTAAVAVGVTAAALCNNGGCSGGGGGGGGSYQYADWDQFFDQYRILIWRCREVATGRFTEDENCQFYAKIDDRWPHKSRFV